MSTERSPSSINIPRATTEVVETYSGKLYLPNGSVKLTTIQKLADAGLAFSILREIYTKFGINGLYGIIALPPSSRDSSCRQTKSPRITSNRRIISSVLSYFHEPWTRCFTWFQFRTFLAGKFHYLQSIRLDGRSQRTTNMEFEFARASVVSGNM